VLQTIGESRSIECAPVMTPKGPRRPSARKELYAEAGIEPALEDLLTDPLTQALMHRDGVSPSSLRALIRATQESLRSRAA
jgi:hypothetical protein